MKADKGLPANEACHPWTCWREVESKVKESLGIEFHEVIRVDNSARRRNPHTWLPRGSKWTGKPGCIILSDAWAVKIHLRYARPIGAVLFRRCRSLPIPQLRSLRFGYIQPGPPFSTLPPWVAQQELKLQTVSFLGSLGHALPLPRALVNSGRLYSTLYAFTLGVGKYWGGYICLY